MEATGASSTSGELADVLGYFPFDGYSITDDLELQIKNEFLVSQFEVLRSSHQNLQARTLVMEERNSELLKAIEQISSERGELEFAKRDTEDEYRRRIDEISKDKEAISTELDRSRERIRVSTEHLVHLKSALMRVIESIDGEDIETPVHGSDEFGDSYLKIQEVLKLTSMVEMKLGKYQEARKKEKRELENSVVSLTEENRDINSLLRIALVEKDAVEKSLNRLKGASEQKRVAILQIAERGLQKVGFGFMIGTATNEPAQDNSGADACIKTDASDTEEEGSTLATAVERIMKNLRLEITQLRSSLEESRSETERLRSLSEKQAQEIVENSLYMKELEEREALLAQNVEELLAEIKETEEEVGRWRQACELEVEAGKSVVEEREQLVSILKQELDKTKAALDISNGKLKLKEELAAAAMAAQAAAERSLQLADSRVVGLNQRVEELTRQVEELESRERSRWKVRHICWPWRATTGNSTSRTNSRTFGRMIPEMQALLHCNV